MIRIVLVVLILLLCAVVGIAEEQPESRPSADEMAVLTGADPPLSLEEQVAEAVTDDGTVTVQSVDGRTVLQMEGGIDDEFSISFSSVAEGVMAHVKLGKGGLNHRFTLVKPEGNDTPIYLDLKGPAVNNGYGVKLTLRF